MQEPDKNDDNAAPNQSASPEAPPQSSQAVPKQPCGSNSSCSSEKSNETDAEDNSDDPSVISETSCDSDTDADSTW